MDRREFLKRAGATAGAALLGLGARSGAVSAAASGKSVIVVICDDLNKQDVLSGIVQFVGGKGVIFENAVVTWPVCCPSRATMFRGQMAHNHKVYYNDGPDGGLDKYRHLGYEEDSLPVWLHDAGIVTYLMGKYNNGYASSETSELGPYVPPGWDRWLAYLSGPPDFAKYSENGTVIEVPGHSVELFADRTERFIREMAAADRRFFLWISPTAPHRPSEVHPDYDDAFPNNRVPRVANFNARGDGEPPWLAKKPILTDTQVGKVDAEYRDRLRSMLPIRDLLSRIVNTLNDPAVGLADDVYLIFTSDNGYHEGNHHLMPQKLTPYDEDVKIPLMVRGPGIPAGTVRKQTVANHDLAPTICDLFGVSHPTWVDGRSFKPLLSADPQPPWPRKAVGIEGWRWNVQWSAIPDIPHYRGVRTGVGPGGAVHKLVKYPFYNPPKYEWYRLDVDRYEMHNKWRAGNPPSLDGDRATFDALDKRAEAIFKASGAALRTAENGT